MTQRQKAAAYDRLVENRRQYNSGYRERLKLRAAAGMIAIPHGTSLGYNVLNCGCAKCKHYKRTHRGLA